MCDLIDLNSPDRKDLLNAKLASPLIPVPTDSLCHNYNSSTNETNSIITGKRDSLENNPFDMVLHKTTEYIQKKDDPFEVTLEQALTLNCEDRTCSLDLTNDAVKQKPCKQKLKLNKALNKSLIDNELNYCNMSSAKISNETVIVDSNNTNTLNNNLQSKDVIPTIDIQDYDLSILKQSMMNDTLFEGDKESNKNQIKSTLQNKMFIRTKKDNGQFPYPSTALKVSKLRRSLSQGENIPPRKTEYLNQISLIEPLRINSDSENNIYSSNSLNLLNEGFLKSHYSGSSVFSSLSNISSIHRLNSVSSTINSSTVLSNGTMNRSFLESCSSEKSENIKLSENMDLNKDIKSVFLTSNNSIISVGNILTKRSISDLTDRFNKLKANTSEIYIPENSLNSKDEHACSSPNDIKDCVTVMEKNENCDINNKLIDVDVFSPDIHCTKEHSKSSLSDTSSDSVFLKGNKIDKSIFNEAKLLARTFEELAFKTSSGSSIDDLITSNSSWTSELLPAFDDEVENLIELPISPVGSDTKSKDEKVENSNSHIDKNKELSNKVKENVKDLEMELAEVIYTEKRLTAATLLLDLKKLIKTENNVEANKLVENLEKTLGINCKNNTELLTTYLNATNNLTRDPQKSNSGLEIIKNVAESNMEHSQEDNLTSNSIENVKDSIFCENINFNDVNMSKCSDNQKYFKKVSSESKCEIPERETNIEEIKGKEAENEHHTQKISKEDSSCKRESNSLLNERVIIELLENIGKVLSAQTKEHPTWDILKNLGKVLDSTPNGNVNKDTKSDSAYIEIQQTPRKSKVKFENKTKSSVLSNSVNRISLDLESAKQLGNKKLIRRSMSLSQTQSFKNESNPLISSSKSTSQLKEVTKRFPSDPSFASTTTSKQIIANNNKNELQRDTQTEILTISRSQKEKTAMVSTVKNKLKKKMDTDVRSKKGPLKAILPIGSMQKRENISKKMTPPSGTITPPKSHKIISSTPNSMDNGLKKTRSSKPVASSTPDAQSSKTCKIRSPVTNFSKKRNFSCDISPVTISLNVRNDNGTNKSPRRSNKLPSPKKTTPKRRSAGSGIPRSQTPPMGKRLNSSFDVNQYERMYESPQRSLYKTSNSQKNSPVSLKKNENNTKQSPLRENNKLMNKVKPINLISKLRRYSVGTNIMEKENNYI
ncbi:hypothetical protein ANTPLA_LOCUS1434 [Anthophora plagiata]